jgi:7,8-dihydropterin-6-yl-methyl-4-(beta-D-ribofuranosyl)aminobenzene 5'-phosphate synthase
MRVTIIYDNTAFRADCKADWGFAARIEAAGRRILFDTGTNGTILLSNMRTLGIAAAEIDDVFISHAHSDHTGGLDAFLRQNSAVTLWVPPSFGGGKTAKRVITVTGPKRLHDTIYSTGELEGIEQALCVATGRGIVVLVGCSHPRMENILRVASRFGDVYGIIGGLHGTRPQSLENLNLICATHCTQHKKEIESLFPNAAIEGGAGRIIDIE